MAETLCLFEEGYTVHYEDMLADAPVSGSTDSPMYFQSYGRVFEIVPNMVPMNETKGSSYRYVTTFYWIDFAMITQIVLFLIPSFIWAHFRESKFGKLFNPRLWTVARFEMFEIEKEDDLLYGNRFTLKDVTVDPYPEIVRERNQTEQNSTSKVFKPKDACLKRLFQIGQSCLAQNLIFVMLSQIGVIVAMCLLWDWLFSFGGNDQYRFSMFGFQLMAYWLDFYYGNVNTKMHSNPSENLFPSIIKCDFQAIGPSGHLQHIDLLCALDANYLLEKIMIFTWFYYFVSALVTLYVLIVDFVSLLVPCIRRRYIQSILDWHIPSSMLKFRQKCYISKIPRHFACPYQVAVFATYLIRNIGPAKVQIVMKHFIFEYNKHIGKLEIDEETLQTKFDRNKGDFEKDCMPYPSDLYGHLFDYAQLVHKHDSFYEPRMEKDLFPGDKKEEEKKDNKPVIKNNSSKMKIRVVPDAEKPVIKAESVYETAKETK